MNKSINDNNPEKEVLFIAAGTRGAKRVANSRQPFIKIDGKTCLEHILESAIRADLVGDICIWGNRNKIEPLIVPYRKEYNYAIRVTDEKTNIIDSLLYAYLTYLEDTYKLNLVAEKWHTIHDIDWATLLILLKDANLYDRQINIITSDTPLLTASELDTMVGQKDPGVELIVGRTRREKVEEILAGVEQPFDYKRAVKNFYNYNLNGKNIELIVNCFVSGKPFHLERIVWLLFQNFFENRTIISGMKRNIDKIKKNLRYSRVLLSQKRVDQKRLDYKDYKARIVAFYFLARSYLAIVRGKKRKKALINLKRIYKNIQILFGIRIEYLITDCFGAAFDLDTEYEIEFVNKNYSKLKELISNSENLLQEKNLKLVN